MDFVKSNQFYRSSTMCRFTSLQICLSMPGLAAKDDASYCYRCVLPALSILASEAIKSNPFTAYSLSSIGFESVG